MPLLDIYKNYDLDHRFVIQNEEITIGRDICNDLILGGDAVSRAHALVLFDGEYYTLIDQSRNGTFVNDRRIKKRRLKDRDVIIIDQWRIVFSANGVNNDPRKTLIRKEPAPKALSFFELDRGWLYQRVFVQIFRFNGRMPHETRLEKHITKIGRAKDNDIILDEDHVADYHGRIVVYGNQIFYENIDSVNGAVVDGISTVRAELHNYSTIEIGKITIKLCIESKVKNREGTSENNFHGIISKDVKMFRLFDTIKMIAPRDDIVCIFGESGTGKDLVAAAIHELSNRRRTGKFISINCGAIPANLMESELFGHERGSFTTAMSHRVGAFAKASGGTLFLDEIGELDMSMQVKLLRVIQNKMVKRVGSDDEKATDVRIIVATNKDLLGQVSKGLFREDLFFRLHVIPLIIPPLRERPDDISILIDHFLEMHSGEKNMHQFSRRAYKKAESYKWPGNVRELENMVIRALAFSENPVIKDVDIEFIDSSSLYPDEAGPAGDYPTWDEIEKNELTKVLRDFNNNKSEAAKALEMPRSSLIRRLKRCGIGSRKV